MAFIFNCDCKISKEVLSPMQTVFLRLDVSKEVPISINICIGNHMYNQLVVAEEIDVVSRIAQAEWYNFQTIILYENIVSQSEMAKSRETLNNTFLSLLRSLETPCADQKKRYTGKIGKMIDIFSNSVLQLSNLQDEILIKISTSTTNNSKCPIFQYFHTYLDIQYYLLMLYYICGASKEKLENRMVLIMKDLMVITKKNYKRHNTQIRQAFPCACIKEFWLILQLFTEKIDSNNTWFWNMFKNIMQYEDPMFTLWLLKNIASLHSINTLLLEDGNNSDRISPNYTLLENKLKDIFSTSGSETLLECFNIIEPLLRNLWLKKSKIEVFQIMWDYYSKRLNISNKKPPQKALEFNDTINTILCSPKDCNEDFEMFVGMLTTHLSTYPSQWVKMKGRIYSQLGPNKVKDLNETGITHVLVLFLSLANINLPELSKKMISFLDDMPMEKRNTLYIWNIYTVFMIRHVVNDNDLKNVAPLMLRMLHEAINDQKQFRLVKEFVENFEHIVRFSKNYQLHQWLLIDAWLPRYLTTCHYADLKTALSTLLFILDKVSNADDWPCWESAYRHFIYSSFKQISNTSTLPEIAGKIGGKLCILIPHLKNESFNFFNGDSMPPRVSCLFLDEVLSKFPNNFILTPAQESMVLQSWMKICLLTTDLHRDLTRHIVKLDCLPCSLKEHIMQCQDPIYAFIEYLGGDIKEHLHSNDIIKLCETCFGQIDKWLMVYLAQPEDEALVLRVYTCMSLAFLHCGPLLYDRNKSASPLTKLVQVLLLPTDFLIGKKTLHPLVLTAVKKTWNVFFEAIVKLNSDLDMFLERTVRDMILKYMPFFSTADPPIRNWLENNMTAPVILDKISNFYFKHPVKESEANTLKVLKVLYDFVRSTTSLPLMTLIVNKCCCGLFEVIIFHTQRNAALGVIKEMTSSPLYPQVSQDFRMAVIAITEKHLAFNTANYFQLIFILAKFVPADVRDLLGNLKHQISNVERLRGVGFDKNLRMQYEKLKNIVEMST